jgi:hypothetical protein
LLSGAANGVVGVQAKIWERVNDLPIGALINLLNRQLLFIQVCKPIRNRKLEENNWSKSGQSPFNSPRVSNFSRSKISNDRGICFSRKVFVNWIKNRGENPIKISYNIVDDKDFQQKS